MVKTGPARKQSATFGPWLEVRIGMSGLSRQQFADRVGVSKSTVWRWINGRVPEASYIEKISDVLVIPYDEVATRAGYRPRGLDELDPDSPAEQIAALARRVAWTEDRYNTARNILSGWIETDRAKQKE